MAEAWKTHLEKLQAQKPALAQDIEVLRDLYERRLWHDLTLSLEAFIRKPVWREDPKTLINLFQFFISGIIQKLSPMRLAKLAVSISHQYAHTEEAIKFLESVSGRLKETQYLWIEQSKVFVLLRIVQLQIHDDYDLVKVKRNLNGLYSSLDHLFDVDPAVWAAYYYNLSILHTKLRDFAEFYKSCLLYIGYVDLEELSLQTKQTMAVDISFAALLGEGVYNFGELLLHPLINVLKGTQGAWLLDMLEAFNSGDLHRYDELCVTHANTLNGLPQMVEREQFLKEKITILALTELIFNLPPDQRTIPFSKIGERTKLDDDGVEFLLMKTLSLKLIKGHIDEVEKTVQVTWVQPRVLTKPQMSALNDRLADWISKVDTATHHLEVESLGIAV